MTTQDLIFALCLLASGPLAVITHWIAKAIAGKLKGGTDESPALNLMPEATPYTYRSEPEMESLQSAATPEASPIRSASDGPSPTRDTSAMGPLGRRLGGIEGPKDSPLAFSEWRDFSLHWDENWNPCDELGRPVRFGPKPGLRLVPPSGGPKE